MRIPILLLFAVASFFSSQADTATNVFNKTLHSLVHIAHDSFFSISDDPLAQILGHISSRPAIREKYGVASGSGVFVGKHLIVTNWHVVKGKYSAKVFFPARDNNGKLITERDTYYNRSADNNKELHTSGVVIADDPSKDLAILHVGEVPEAASVATISEDTLNIDDRLHILGNPAGRPLWRWTLGSYLENTKHTRSYPDGQSVNFDAIKLNSSAYFGNSGGPIFDDQSRLVGLAQSIAGEGGEITYGVSAKEVRDLLASVRPQRRHCISNKTNESLVFKVGYTNKELSTTREMVIRPDAITNFAIRHKPNETLLLQFGNRVVKIPQGNVESLGRNGIRYGVEYCKFLNRERYYFAYNKSNETEIFVETIPRYEPNMGTRSSD